jgi:transglycosylase-like protein with SLT domain
VKRPTARGCAGALVAVALVAAAVVAPRSLGESVVVAPRIETYISSACGGASSPCPSPERMKWLGELEHMLAERMPTLPAGDRSKLADTIYQEAREASLDPLLVLAVIAVESGFDHAAESDAGAVGLMQLRPSTLLHEAERSGLDLEDPGDPSFNVRTGVRYFKRLIRAFGSTDVALMAYNAGPNRILRYLQEEGAIPERFRIYPKRVAGELKRLKRNQAPAMMAAPEQRAPQRSLASAAPSPVVAEAGPPGAR